MKGGGPALSWWEESLASTQEASRALRNECSPELRGIPALSGTLKLCSSPCSCPCCPCEVLPLQTEAVRAFWVVGPDGTEAGPLGEEWPAALSQGGTDRNLLRGALNCSASSRKLTKNVFSRRTRPRQVTGQGPSGVGEETRIAECVSLGTRHCAQRARGAGALRGQVVTQVYRRKTTFGKAKLPAGLPGLDPSLLLTLHRRPSYRGLCLRLPHSLSVPPSFISDFMDLRAQV